MRASGLPSRPGMPPRQVRIYRGGTGGRPNERRCVAVICPAGQCILTRLAGDAPAVLDVGAGRRRSQQAAVYTVDHPRLWFSADPQGR